MSKCGVLLAPKIFCTAAWKLVFSTVSWTRCLPPNSSVNAAATPASVPVSLEVINWKLFAAPSFDTSISSARSQPITS